MGRKTNSNFQNAAARRELEADGVSEARIVELERDWDEYTARQGRPTPLLGHGSSAWDRRRTAALAKGLHRNSF